MKTKIIYISGNEVFEMADIRAAFEEVRATLGLDKDTVLFGVPVDADDALGAAATTVAVDATTVETAQAAEIAVPVAEPDAPAVVDTPNEDAPAVVMDTPADEKTAPAPRKKATARRTRAAAAKESETPIIPENATPDNITAAAPETDTVVPILSVLAAHADSADDNETPDNAEIEIEIVETVADAPVTDAPIEAAAHDDVSISEHDDVSISEMISDDAPVDNSEKTLEELLESMTPLREDAHDDAVAVAEPAAPADAPSFDTGTTDATLEQLASEFAQNQDKIVATPKNETHGKIGKLKNILPFKKAKREDTGIMGDLFGWAGIAANDEDFSIPGFFTTTAKK